MANAIEFWNKHQRKSIARYPLDTDTGTDGQGIAFSPKTQSFFIVTQTRLAEYKIAGSNAVKIKRTNINVSNFAPRGVYYDKNTDLIFVCGYTKVSVFSGGVIIFENWHTFHIYDRNHTLIHSKKRKISTSQEYARDIFAFKNTRNFWAKMQPKISAAIRFYYFPKNDLVHEIFQASTSETGTGIGQNKDNFHTFFYPKAGAFGIRLMDTKTTTLIANFSSTTIGKPRSCDDMEDGFLCVLTI